MKLSKPNFKFRFQKKIMPNWKNKIFTGKYIYILNDYITWPWPLMTLTMTKVIDLDLYFKLTYQFSTSGAYFHFYAPKYIYILSNYITWPWPLMTLNLTKVIDLDLYFKLTYSFSTSGTYFRFYGPPYIMTIYALCNCSDFTTRGKLLTTKLLQQGYVCNRLKSTIK